MGLLSALKLPRPKSWPPETAANEPAIAAPAVAVGRRAETVSAGGGAFEGEDEAAPQKIRTSAPDAEAPTSPPAKDTAGAQTEARADAEGDAEAQDEADVDAEVRGGESARAEAAPEKGKAARREAAQGEAAEGKAAAGPTAPPVSLQVSENGTVVTVKKTADGGSIAIKDEVTEPVFKDTFMVGPVPCFTKGEVSLAFEGEISTAGKTAGLKVQLTAGWAFSLGVGVAKGCVTVGPLGQAKLTCSQGVAVTYSEADGVTADAFVCEVKATGSVGFEASIDKGPKIKAEVKLVEWQLLIVHVAGFAHGKFVKGTRVEPGKDLQRLIAAMQNAGPKIADAVEKYAPEKVKKAAEDGAKWVAESEDAKKIADGTEVVLDKIKKETGVDIGDGAESVVRDLVDPGGETSAEATKRVEAEMAELNASHEAFMTAVQKLGLAPGGELQSTSKEDADEYNAIVEVHQKEGRLFGGTPEGAWKPMLMALASKRRDRRAARLAEQAEKKRREKADGDAKAAADLARRMKESEAAMNAALTAANMLGNPLNNRTQGQPGSKARKYWETGMNKFWSPGSTARLKCASLQGEAKIAKAQEATALLVKARAVFQEGMRMIE